MLSIPSSKYSCYPHFSDEELKHRDEQLQMERLVQRGEEICLRSHSKLSHIWDLRPGLLTAINISIWKSKEGFVWLEP